MNFPHSTVGKESTFTAGDLGSISGLGITPGKSPHSSILAWRIPWTVQSMGSQSWTRLSDFHFSLSHGKLRKNFKKTMINLSETKQKVITS